VARPIGRPRAVETPEQAWELGEAYFQKCDEAKEPYLITGLALALGFNSRSQIYEYEARPEFTSVIKSLRTRVEHSYELGVITEKGNPAGRIFIMKNMGYSDRCEHTGPAGGPIQVDSKIEIVLTTAERKP